MEALARRPLICVFAAALIPRLVLAIVVRLRFGGYLYLDDKSYVDFFQRYAESAGMQKAPIWDSVPSYSRPLALLSRYVWNDPLAAQIATVMAGSLSAVFVAFAVGRLSDRRRSILAGLLVAWWPSQIFWSSLVLRDAFIWMAVSSVIAAWSLLGNSLRASKSIGLVLYSFAAVAYVAGSRKHSALVLVLSIIVALLFSARSHRVLVGAAFLLAFAPLSLGFGPFGWQLFRDGTEGITAGRTREVTAAQTPIRCWDLPLLPPGDETQGGWRDDLLCLPTTVPGLLIMPTPDQAFDNPDLVPPLLELPGWIALYAFALRSCRKGTRKNPLTAFAASYATLTIALWALVDRVVGTAFRHRSELFAALVVLAMIGNRQQNHGKDSLGGSDSSSRRASA